MDRSVQERDEGERESKEEWRMTRGGRKRKEIGEGGSAADGTGSPAGVGLRRRGRSPSCQGGKGDGDRHPGRRRRDYRNWPRWSSPNKRVAASSFPTCCSWLACQPQVLPTVRNGRAQRLPSQPGAPVSLSTNMRKKK
ncbi:uncharacterized protein [Triticum aestivum]|uniref:uncharacterized protein isoform X2 n=1 Tax=Triticum aestivum TaxID=4565 RepID=UPI001D012681|nr:uncharacterized protein LOC123191872 isoform X2 [Triticum aestivum]